MFFGIENEKVITVVVAPPSGKNEPLLLYVPLDMETEGEEVPPEPLVLEDNVRPVKPPIAIGSLTHVHV